MSSFNNALLMNTVFGIPPHHPASLISRTTSSSNSSFTDPRSIFPLNLSNSNNNNNSSSADTITDNDSAGENNNVEEKISVKSSSIADLRLKAKKHQEALGINDPE